MNKLESIFNVLSKKFPDYENRLQQIEMASEVFRCLKKRTKRTSQDIEDVKEMLLSAQGLLFGE